MENKFQKFVTLAKDAESVQKLRKKVTHDIEHQINDLIALRGQIAKMAGITVETITIPEFSPISTANVALPETPRLTGGVEQIPTDQL